MATYFTLNPSFEHLRTFIAALPDTFSGSGEILYKGRNEIRIFEKEGLRLNVKEYGIPVFPNRIIYHLFRTTKAQRAYEYAFRLKEAGFNTPEPVAFIITRQRGLLGKCYFISLQVDYPRRFYEFGTEPLEGKEHIVRDFGLFTAQLHNAGIYHKDYSPGNILFDTRKGKTEFCLVDINRMEFKNVTLQEGCRNFARLWGKEPFFRLLAETYAEERHYNPQQCVREVLKYRREFWIRYLRCHPAKFELDL
ncbi:MAG: lipopolysaccharide kinase InaA family protein [Odoribacter sp.]|nr:lipopolysaccharide kinase InaA family protein [Odoribacter sp.]